MPAHPLPPLRHDIARLPPAVELTSWLLVWPAALDECVVVTVQPALQAVGAEWLVAGALDLASATVVSYSSPRKSLTAETESGRTNVCTK